ncbi:MAG: aldo/keto reductase, partial [Oscillospiraceae bacterium]|nr:aldo/keto reductase [Oscillospiraceae bacterium]
KVSLLAFGCMRFPKDNALTEKMIMTAFQKGVNYFDTAYIYPGSELTLGRIVEKNNLRDKIFIATKMPVFMVKKPSDFDKYFNIQLERLRTDRIDYYLMHMLSGPDSWKRIQELGVEEWIAEKKQSGKIKNIGFSYHGGADGYKALIDAYNWEFSMIMYNYYDVNNQAGRSGLLYAAEKGVPIMVMEPLRGGKLMSKLPENAVRHFNYKLPEHTPAEWAFRWVFSHNEVLTVLSGMNSIDVVENNISTASDTESYELTEQQTAVFEKVRGMITSKIKIPCTSCGYCMPCRNNVDIPLCFACYNDIALEGRNKAFIDYTYRVGAHRASLCTGCGECESRCSQRIEIRKTLKDVKRKMEGGVYKPVSAVIRKFMRIPK